MQPRRVNELEHDGRRLTPTTTTSSIRTGSASLRPSPLAGRVAVVTGSTRGLGLAMARVLGRSGATVVVSSRSAAHVQAAVDALRTEGLDVTGLTCDTTVLSDVEALRDHALAQGTLAIWVNNAGVSGVYGPTASTPVDDFTTVVRTNILGTFHGSRVALPVFLEQGFGDLVNLYGEGDRGPVAMQNAYASSKRWVRQFTETLQRETRRSRVRVHGMNPGLVTTELLTRITAQKGYEGRLDVFPVIIALWGRTPAEAASPLLRLVTTTRPVYRGLHGLSLVTRAVRSIATGRLRATNRARLQVSTLDPEDASRRGDDR
ncbi:SDR family NAD(P)-dependent oxidoreductase [Leifsonia sp. EB34]|uniref:SDR family NAD(P)-dependent oxidoreductase n=1 Tax=Leifsonia sp. EB34 TaxID=3156303 RepID=UPI00351606C4